MPKDKVQVGSTFRDCPVPFNHSKERPTVDGNNHILVCRFPFPDYTALESDEECIEAFKQILANFRAISEGKTAVFKKADGGTVEYEPIPWSNGKNFPTEKLAGTEQVTMNADGKVTDTKPIKGATAFIPQGLPIGAQLINALEQGILPSLRNKGGAELKTQFEVKSESKGKRGRKGPGIQSM